MGVRAMIDIENGPIREEPRQKDIAPQADEIEKHPRTPDKRLQRWTEVLERVCSLETRGIERVEENEHQEARSDDYVRVFLLELSSFLTSNNIIVGCYGPLLFGLNLGDAAACAVFGTLLGSAGVGYMSTWGPRSGNRTLVITRCFLGYHVSKICCVLNILTMLGYGMINCILGGQVIYAITNGETTVRTGIIVVAVLTWVIATFGVHLFQFSTRYAWMMQILILAIMVGCAGPHFYTGPMMTAGPSGSVNARRLSFLSLCTASVLTNAACSADYFVYFPVSIRPWKMCLFAAAGMSLAVVISTVIGIGLATGISTNKDWAKAYLASPGSLLATGFAELKGFGKFCSVILIQGMVSNNIPCTYSAALNLQMLGHYGVKIPRPVLTTFNVVLFTVCALLGDDYLKIIIENFLPLMSYWITIWLMICLEEIFLFKRDYHYKWSAWNDNHKFPLGFAAGFTLFVGAVSAVLAMSQQYFVGPVVRHLPPGCDLGIWLAAASTLLIYPPLRWTERRMFRR